MRLVRLKVDRPVSTDDILPARYKHMHSDPQLLAPHVFENILPGLNLRDCALVSPVLFGIGSSREQAVSAQEITRIQGTPALATAGNITTLSKTIPSGRKLASNCRNGPSTAIAVSTIASHVGPT